MGVNPRQNRFAGGRRPVWLQRQVAFSVLARSRTWSSTFAGSRANPPHSEDAPLLLPIREPAEERGTGTFCSQGTAKSASPRRFSDRLLNALPRNRTSSDSFEDCHAPAHPQGHSIQNSPTWNSIRTCIFGGSMQSSSGHERYNESRRLHSRPPLFAMFCPRKELRLSLILARF